MQCATCHEYDGARFIIWIIIQKLVCILSIEKVKLERETLWGCIVFLINSLWPKNMEQLVQKIDQMYAAFTGQLLEKVQQYTERDRFLSSSEVYSVLHPWQMSSYRHVITILWPIFLHLVMHSYILVCFPFRPWSLDLSTGYWKQSISYKPEATVWQFLGSGIPH